MMRLRFRRGSRTLTIGHQRPYWIKETEGLGSVSVDVDTQKASAQDGELYRGAVVPRRNISITASIIPPAGDSHGRIREEFFSFFVPREEGELVVEEGSVRRRIDYRVESCEFVMDGLFRDVTLSLVCCDPVFKALHDEYAYMAAVLGLIEWPLELPDQFEAGIRTDELIATVRNDSDVTRGLTITFRASGEVVNPGLTEISRQESLCVLTTMHAGDAIIITTAPGNKRVRLLREGTESSINNLWQFGGVWLQVLPGDNVFAFHAAAGEASMEVTLQSTPAFWGA